jgi:hypothetical protein
MPTGAERKTRATTEYLLRIADGGTDADSNIAMGMPPCNNERWDAPVEGHAGVASHICS